MKKQTALYMLLGTPFLVPLTLWLLNFLPGETMAFQEVEQRAKQLAGPDAVFCGHIPLPPLQGSSLAASKLEGKRNRDLYSCEVAAYRAGKPFYSIIDGGGGGGPFQPYALSRTVTLLTPQGKLILLECTITRQTRPKDEVRLYQSECPNPRIFKLPWNSSIECLSCD